MNNLKKLASIAAGFLAVSFVSASTTSQMAKYDVNTELADHVKTFQTASLIKMGDNVYMAQGYNYSNFGFIVGEDGIVAVDCGWFPETSAKAWADLRKVTNKPLKAIIYTHGHGDHLGGCSAFMENDNAVPIYAHSNYTRYRNEQVSSKLPFILNRATAQMGFLLPENELGNVGTGIGKATYAGNPKYYQPTNLLSGNEVLNIAGIDIKIINAPSELDDELAVWLPQQKVMFVADTIGGTGPYAATPRAEEGRDPEAFFKTLDNLLSFNPHFIIPGHGRGILGKNDVNTVLTNARDTIQYMIDHIIRGMGKGTSRDEIVSSIELPPHLANSKDLGWYYHPMEWVARGIYARYAGWMGDNPVELFSTEPKKRADFFIRDLGGIKSAQAKAKSAVKRGDYAWATEIANTILQQDPKNKLAKNIVSHSLRTQAYKESSSSRRFYMLHMANIVDGSLNMKKARPLLDVGALLDSANVMRLAEVLRTQLKSKESFNTQESINLYINEEEGITLTIRKGILRVADKIEDASLPSMSMDRKILTSVVLNQLTGATFDSMIKAGEISMTDDKKVKHFISYLR